MLTGDGKPSIAKREKTKATIQRKTRVIGLTKQIQRGSSQASKPTVRHACEEHDRLNGKYLEPSQPATCTVTRLDGHCLNSVPVGVLVLRPQQGGDVVSFYLAVQHMPRVVAASMLLIRILNNYSTAVTRRKLGMVGQMNGCMTSEPTGT